MLASSAYRTRQGAEPPPNPNLVTARDAETGDLITLDFAANTVTGISRDGNLVTMDIGVADVHIDVPLANYAIGYFTDPELMIADRVMPVVLTDKASDKYYIFDKDDEFQQAHSVAATPGGNVNESTPRQSNTNFVTNQYAWKTFLPTEVEANADAPLQLAMRYMRLPLTKLLLARELRVATAVTTAANYGANAMTLASGAKWNGGASSDPVANIHAAMEASLMPITHMAMSERTWHAFQRNAQVQKYIASKTNVRPLAKPNSPEEFAAILELPTPIIGARKYKSSASAYSYIWGNDVVLFHMPKNWPPMGEAVAFNTFRWKGGTAAPGVTVEGGLAIRSYFNPLRGPGGGREIVVYHHDGDQFVDSSVAYLIKDAWQA